MPTTAAAIELPNGLEANSLGEDIGNKWSSWDTARQVWKKRVAEIQQYIYATSTKETTNAENGWSHTTHIPKLTQIFDNLGANYSNALFGNRKFFVFEPATRKEATKKKDRVMRAYLETKHEASGFRAVMKRCLDDWTQTGNCFAKIEYVRITVKNPVTGIEEVVYEGPKVMRISPYDIVFDHSAAEFNRTPKIVRSLVHRAELERTMQECEEGDYDLEEFLKFTRYRQFAANLSGGDVEKLTQQQFDGFATPEVYFNSGKVEILELIGDIYDYKNDVLHKDRVITVIDRRYVIRNKPLADLTQFGQIYHCGWRKRSDNLWAQGPLDNLLGLQYMIDHLINAKADAFDQMLSPDRVHIGNVDIKQNGPVTNYFIDDAQGDVRNLAPDTTALNADMQIERMEAWMEAYAGAPREAMGIRSPGEKTAFEVEKLDNAAGRLFQTKIEDFESEFEQPILNGEIEVAVRNLNTSDVGKLLDDDLGVQEFLKITKEDLVVKGRIRARGASHFAKRAQRVRELQAFGGVLQLDPAMAVHFPAKPRAQAWADALGYEDNELYVPYGSITEAVETQRATLAAQRVIDGLTAAANAPPPDTTAQTIEEEAL